MAGKHTAGPWSVAGTTIYALEHEGWRRGAEVFRNRFDARAQGPHCPIDELEANARLIAAAPDLLEALQALVSNRYSCFIPEDGSVVELYEWTEKARELIARATQPLPPQSEEV